MSKNIFVFFWYGLVLLVLFVFLITNGFLSFLHMLWAYFTQLIHNGKGKLGDGLHLHSTFLVFYQAKHFILQVSHTLMANILIRNAIFTPTIWGLVSLVRRSSESNYQPSKKWMNSLFLLSYSHPMTTNIFCLSSLMAAYIQQKTGNSTLSAGACIAVSSGRVHIIYYCLLSQYCNWVKGCDVALQHTN